MLTPDILAAFKEWVPYPWLQGLAFVLMIALIIGFVIYRRKQM